MLRVHNELRAAVGAPAVRTDDRVTKAAQRHADYLAQNNALGHDESPGASGFTGASVRDRLVEQGYADANASEVATSFSSGTEGVPVAMGAAVSPVGLMPRHAIVAGWGHAESRAARSPWVSSCTTSICPRQSGSRARTRSTRRGQNRARRSPRSCRRAAPARPVGIPDHGHYGGARAVDLKERAHHRCERTRVPHHVVPQLYERDYSRSSPRVARGWSAVPGAFGSSWRRGLVDEWEFETER